LPVLDTREKLMCYTSQASTSCWRQ